MASITTQTVGAASAGAVATAAVREAVALKRPEQAKAATQEADRVTISASKREDSERAPAQPKRAEATYARTPLKRK